VRAKRWDSKQQQRKSRQSDCYSPEALLHDRPHYRVLPHRHQGSLPGNWCDAANVRLNGQPRT
jgi:hypothetical protein